MNLFDVVVKNKQGKIVTLPVRAKNLDHAHEKLSRIGMVVIKQEKPKPSPDANATKKKQSINGLSVCKNCGYVGKAKTVTQGYFLIEVILWFCLFFPGLIYSVWRLSTRERTGCPVCKQSSMIPVTSCIGEKLITDLNIIREQFF